MSVSKAVAAFVDNLERDALGDARASVARALAAALDQATGSKASGASLQAAASAAKELRAVLDQIAEAAPDDDELLEALMGRGRK